MLATGLRKCEIQDALVAQALHLAALEEVRHDAAQLASSAHISRSPVCSFLSEVMRKSMQHFDRGWSRIKVVPAANN